MYLFTHETDYNFFLKFIVIKNLEKSLKSKCLTKNLKRKHVIDILHELKPKNTSYMRLYLL